jgi:hypothetical protein
MKKNVLFIQGGGSGAHAADQKLAASLQEHLGGGYQVHYPRMPNEGDPEYAPYRSQIAKELASLDGPVILVAHSMGGTVLLHFLTEEQVEQPIGGIFLIAAPFWSAEEWFDAPRLLENLASSSGQVPPIHFYHSRDDPVVPFMHLALYAARLPQAATREFEDRAHQFSDDLAEVAADIFQTTFMGS